MRVTLFIVGLLMYVIQVESQFWNNSPHFLQSWIRRGRTVQNQETTDFTSNSSAKKIISQTTIPVTISETSMNKRHIKIKNITIPIQITKTTADLTTVPITTQSSTVIKKTTLNINSGSMNTLTEVDALYETTITHDVTGTTEESRDNSRIQGFYLSTNQEKPVVKISSNISQNLLPLPAGASAALVKPTKYHYYPHNQHIYLLPECAIQQVCNAVYLRLNWTQPLCACPSRYKDPCSASLNSDDQHTTELMIDKKSERALTLVKTCELTTEMRVCRSPRDWSLLALQNIRTGKSHYLVICRCPDTSILEGPMSHDQPIYASVPGIRVYGMMCVDGNRKDRRLRSLRPVKALTFPWDNVAELAKTALWD